MFAANGRRRLADLGWNRCRIPLHVQNRFRTLQPPSTDPCGGIPTSLTCSNQVLFFFENLPQRAKVAAAAPPSSPKRREGRALTRRALASPRAPRGPGDRPHAQPPTQDTSTSSELLPARARGRTIAPARWRFLEIASTISTDELNALQLP